MSTLSHMVEIFWFLADPFIFMGQSLSHLPGTILSVLRTGDFATLLSPSRFHTAWFGRFWAVAGPEVRKTSSPRVVPLLQGRVRHGVATDQQSGPPVGGVVLEVGAGSGMWPDDDQTGGGAITKIYGVEPNPASHAALRRRVRESGLEGIYEAVPVGIEELGHSTKWDGRIEEGSVDCIVSILCWCSIPDPEKNIAALYKFLKRGGRWYVYEHVKARRTVFMPLYQRFVNLFWPRIIGGCEMCRDTEKHLRAVGPWEHIDLVQPPAEPWCHPLPHIYGTLTK
ncbi:S-adenosyl-L-methionine-dependent methyltransferase [Sodiomyces alkalinus F11]|uniref:S-adenosyl-L-methionine-dependent methyltransferase n=1 Tax=Sodiomyces alkalinus (strain CBS 110278 / VKM F-3762 / F11) TaxID=1314773 RepID=A0A3N2Q3Y1_SODAK|nr:S-adenosyl-L-methionine-dependent methyltransferase [Sodiomyces alkalinus F11]ROT41335.1 S-adenosyl-L-methionine-dependent methyltransferase [Sodiomyces alkalinus F11]